MKGEEELNKSIEECEIECALKKLENGKAAGEDGCINEILKYGGEKMKKSLLILFRKMWKEEKVPIEWARGIIVPIFKEGEKKNVDNYRGITLLSVVGKLYTSILNSRITSWLEKKKKIVEEQGGFRAKRSTSEQIFYIERGNSESKKNEKENLVLFFRYQESL